MAHFSTLSLGLVLGSYMRDLDFRRQFCMESFVSKKGSLSVPFVGVRFVGWL